MFLLVAAGAGEEVVEEEVQRRQVGEKAVQSGDDVALHRQRVQE